MTTKKRVVIALAVLVLIASLPYAAAQQSIGIRIYICDYDGCSYGIGTGAIDVSAWRQWVWIPSFGISNPNLDLPEDNGSRYNFDFLGVFEANDTNHDGTFDPAEDQFVGSILPTWGIGEWEHINPLPWEVTQYLYEYVELNYSNEVFVTHQHPIMLSTINGWTGIPGHARYMDIAIDVDAQFYISALDQFKVNFRVSGWDWTHEDSLLVFVFITQHRVSWFDPNSGGKEKYPNWNLTHIGNRFQYGEAWMEYSSIATADSVDQVQVHASSFASNPFSIDEPTSELIFISFENFGNEVLKYDAAFGMNTTIPSGTIPTDILPSPSIPFSPPSTTPIDYAQLVLAAGSVSLAVIVIIIILERRRANGKKNSGTA